MVPSSAVAAVSPPPAGSFTTPFLLVSLNPDGATLSRPPDVLLPPSSTGPVVSKDVPLDPPAGTSLRIYRPRQNQLEPGEGRPSLPLIVFHHGGGFILFSAASAVYHAFCENLAAALPAVVVSVDYRLAPEHRLPAAYDDAVSALRWLSGQAAAAAAERGGGGEEELLRGVDYSRCFLMGSSSGANIVYHAGLRAAGDAEALRPLRVAGHVYIQPYFGGVERTASELAMEDDAFLPLRAADAMWEMALPEGAGRGHEFCDAAAKANGAAAGMLPRSLVRGNAGDPLIDRQREFAGLLQAAGVDVVERLDNDGHHAVELFNPAEAQRLFDDVRAFVCSTPTATADVN